VMQHDRTPAASGRPAAKGCPACGQSKPAGEFYRSRGRLSGYCKPCQRRISNQAYRRRRQDAAERERSARSTVPASAPSGRAWPGSTPAGNAAPARPAAPPSAG
jgi:hypothetical protein